MIQASIFRTSVVAARISYRRPLSTTCTQSLDRLNNILENYRASHYSQELHRRFHKDIVKAASTRSSSSSFLSPASAAVSPGIVSAEGIEHVLNNIGAGDQMSHDEIETILREVGGSGHSDSENCVISADQMLDLISKRVL
ncbi:hypothetical protein ACHAXR_005805 [Thalassiosira sp. AJA248-18]